MSYLQRRNPRSHKILFGTLFVLALLLVIVFVQPRFLGNSSRAFGLPFLRMRAAAGDSTSIFGEAWTAKKKLAEENQTLKEEVTKLKLKASLYDEVKAEYEDLRHFENETDIFAYARVLSTPRTAGYDILLLDIGSAEGVREGNTVTGYDSVLLGRVESVGEHSARVALFSSPKSEVPVVFPKSGVDAVARGQGGGAFILEVPQDTEIQAGDAISLRSVSGKMVAVVAEVSIDPTDAFKTVYAAVPVNIYDLRHVGILR